MTNTIIRFLTIVLAALLAGTSFGIWMGFNPKHFSPSTYVEQQQHLVHSLNILMFILVIGATLLTIVSAFLQKKNKTVFITLLISAAFFIGCIFITRLGNYPIQNEMLGWNVNTLPENWQTLRDQWWSFHIQRTITELIALCLIVWTTIKKENNG